MIHTPSTLIEWLLDRCVLRPSDPIHGELAIEDVSRLHCNYAIWLRGEPVWFVKVAPSGAPNGLLNELVAYRLLGEHHERERSDWFITPVAVDEQHGILVLPHIAGAVLSQLWASPDFDAISAGLSLGASLRELHDISSTRSVISPRPWVFESPHPTLDFVTGLSGAGLQLTRIAQGSSVLMNSLAHNSANWQPSCATHGDLRLENVLIRDDAACTPTLIDWETFGVGDPAWDLACLGGRLIAAWTMHVDPADSSKESFQAATALASNVLASAASMFQSSLSSYARGGGGDVAATTKRVRSYLPAVLLHTAYEACQHQPRLPRSAVVLAQLAENLAADDGAAAALLSLEPS